MGNVYQMNFKVLKSICRFRHDGFTSENYISNELIDTCRHIENQPKGCSWGKCNETICPIIQQAKNNK